MTKQPATEELTLLEPVDLVDDNAGPSDDPADPYRLLQLQDRKPEPPRHQGRQQRELESLLVFTRA
jgi:hypothetical protein